MRYLHSVEYQDMFGIERNKILSIARSDEELCTSILFPSIMRIHKDALRKKDQLAVCIRTHKKDGDLSCILQIEFSSDDQAKKGKAEKKTKNSPKKKKAQQFSHCDEMMLRFIAMMLQVRLEKHLSMRDAHKKI